MSRITLDSSYFSGLTAGAQDHLIKQIETYADKIVTEAQNIEKMERVGSGPPEITTTHLQEAHWVYTRKMRRRSTSKWTWVLRILQFVVTVIIGVGASNTNQTWGIILTAVGVVSGAILFIIEREIEKDK